MFVILKFVHYQKQNLLLNLLYFITIDNFNVCKYKNNKDKRFSIRKKYINLMYFVFIGDFWFYY